METRERRQFVLALSLSVERSMKYKSTGCVLERFGTHLHVLIRLVYLYGLRSDKSRFDLSSFYSARTIRYCDFTARGGGELPYESDGDARRLA